MPGLKGGAKGKLSDTEPLEQSSTDSLSQGRIDTSLDPGIYHLNRGFEASIADSQGTLYTETTVTEDSRKPIYGVDENKERGNWTGRYDFLLSLLGYAVGLGNVWRFPYLCYRNGGGAFLLPFVLMMAIIGVPMFYLEASLGQFSSSGPMTCWKFAPLFKGVGIAMMIVSVGTAIYYNMILAWAYYYLFVSFTSSLPWEGCGNYWNSKDCSLNLPLVDCDTDNIIRNTDGTCYVGEEFQGVWDFKIFRNATGRRRISPAEEYWNKVVLQISDGIDDFGTPRWHLVLCLLLAWIVCFFCLIKGIKSTGKVVYFTATFPYVVLFILLIRGALLENAGDGIYFYIVPTWERLADPRVWKDAAIQIFFSMSIAGGGLMTLSSYNRFHNNILRDTILVSIGDTLTCILAGFVIFSYLGFMAGKLGVEVKDVAQDGAGLAFVVYPEAVTSMPAPPVWSILFFFMLILLGLDSQFAMLETCLTGTLDQFPHLRPRKTLVILVLCMIFFLLGLPLTTNGGMYLLQLMDNYVGGWTLLIIAVSELIAVAFVYGVPRFLRDIEVMLGKPQSIYWKICWYGLTPVTLAFIFVFTFVDYSASTYGDYQYPTWADAMGWIMAISSIVAIFITMIYKLYHEDESTNILEKLRLQVTPTEEWGPALPQHRKLVHYVEGWVIDPLKDRRTYTNSAFTDQSSTNVSVSDLSLVTQARSTGDISSATSLASHMSYESTV